jgi:hypothetical protein
MVGLGGLAAAALVAAGCQAPRPEPNIVDPDPSVSIPGIKEAGDRRDRSAAPELVEALGSDDPAIRFFAIGALQEIAGGETFGYEYYHDEEQRKPAVEKWRAWLKVVEAAAAAR